MQKSLPFISSVILGAAFLNYRLGWLVGIGLVPLLIFLHNSSGKRRDKLLVWLAGVLFFAISSVWMAFINPSVLEGLSQPTAVFLTVLGWVIAVLVFSLSWLLFILILDKFRSLSSLRRTSAIVVIPLAWVVGEYLRSWLFSIAFVAPEATLGPHWNFGNLGLGLAATPLAPIGRSLGLFGLAFVAVAINIAWLWLINKRWRAAGIIMACIFGVYLLSTVPYRATGSQKLNIGVAQLPAAGVSKLPELAPAAQADNKTVLDILVLPEYTDSSLFSRYLDKTSLARLFQGLPGAIVYSTTDPHQNTAYLQPTAKPVNKLILADQNNRILSVQSKFFLIPGGEYMPIIGRGLVRLSGQQKGLETFKQARSLTKPSAPERLTEFNGWKIGSLACSGVITPSFYRQLAKQGSDILTNSASLAAFNRTPFYFEQAKTMARFHAIANNQPFVQAAQGGPSYIIESNGRFAVELNDNNARLTSAEVTIANNQTVYSKFGEYTVIVAIAVVGFMALKRIPAVKKLASGSAKIKA